MADVHHGRSLLLHYLYYIEPFIDTTAVAKVSDFQKWRLKLGHLNKICIKQLKSDYMVQNLNFTNFESVRECNICIQSKQSLRPFPKISKYESADSFRFFCNPMPVPSPEGFRCFATFIDAK